MQGTYQPSQQQDDLVVMSSFGHQNDLVYKGLLNYKNRLSRDNQRDWEQHLHMKSMSSNRVNIYMRKKSIRQVVPRQVWEVVPRSEKLFQGLGSCSQVWEVVPRQVFASYSLKLILSVFATWLSLLTGVLYRTSVLSKSCNQDRECIFGWFEYNFL